jgi:prepilin-type N-terminal cleavage/methylation domain-containing protein
VFQNKKGVSLVEVMIALVILLLVFMGLLQAALLGIDSNMRNILRDEAVKIVSEKMEEARSMPFDNVITNPKVCVDTNGRSHNLCTVNDECRSPETCVAPTPVTLNACNPNNFPMLISRDFRNIRDFRFGSKITVSDLETVAPINTKRIEIEVRWEHKNECYTHRISSVRRR